MASCSTDPAFDRTLSPMPQNGTGRLLVSLAVYEPVAFMRSAVINSLRFLAPATKIVLHMSATTAENDTVLQCFWTHPPALCRLTG